MGKQGQNSSGFTLFELIVSMAVIAIVSVIGVNALISTITTTKIVTAAQDLASFLKQARSYAVTQGCKTRVIICTNKHCENASEHSTSPSPAIKCSGADSSSYHCDSSTNPALYYGLLINSFPCSSADQNSADDYRYWDFDKSPLGALPSGVVFSAIYTSSTGVLKSDDGSVDASNVLSFSGGTGTNALWFDPSLNPSSGNLPVADNRTSTGNFIAFQIAQANCNPATTDTCIGYFVTMSPGGVAGIQRCLNGTRADSTDFCF